MTEKIWPNWAPPEMIEWLRTPKNTPQEMLRFYEKLLTDPRMKDVWEWHKAAPKKESILARNQSFSLCFSIVQSIQMPGKPGNMPPKEREKYLLAVRQHAESLSKLLRGTRYDNSDDTGVEFDDELIHSDAFGAELKRDLWSWGVDESSDGHVVAYRVHPDGISKLPWDYPDSHLIDHLLNLIEWTYEDEYLDRSVVRSSAPIGQANTRSARTIYFTCTLWPKLKRINGETPFSILATITNVALNLPIDAMVDEDTVRKQIRRYESRMNAKESTAKAYKDLMKSDWPDDDAPF